MVGSVNSEKPALKLKFDKYIEEQLAFGMERMILNNNVSDPSFIKQYLTYGLFRKAGMPAPLCNFAIVRVNGEDLGLSTWNQSRSLSYSSILPVARVTYTKVQ
ncbi:hypothetical protein CMK17_02350 [Candidatus Poribacteria bacterium]|nr:hypothetical protein [Candidatus Poribacteria bacterium]